MIGMVIMIGDSAISDRSIGKIADELPLNAGVLVKSRVKPDERGNFLQDGKRITVNYRSLCTVKNS